MPISDEQVGRIVEETKRHFDEKTEETKRHFDAAVGQFREESQETRRHFDAAVGQLREESQETRRHFDVVAEGLRKDVQLVAEGLITLEQKMDRQFAEVRSEMNEIKSMIRFSYAELDRRLSTLEEGHRALAARVERLEAQAQG